MTYRIKIKWTNLPFTGELQVDFPTAESARQHADHALPPGTRLGDGTVESTRVELRNPR